MDWLGDAKRERQRLEEEEARRAEEKQREILEREQNAQREVQARMNRRIEMYNALNPMVRRLLEDLGQVQWGGDIQ